MSPARRIVYSQNVFDWETLRLESCVAEEYSGPIAQMAPPTPAEELKATLEGLGSGFEAFKAKYDAELKAEREHREELERKINRQRVSGAGAASLDQPADGGPEIWRDLKSGQDVPILSHKHRLSDRAPNKTGISAGRWLRGILIGNRADDAKVLEQEREVLANDPALMAQRKALEIGNDAAGGYTVPTILSAELIDQLRAQLVLSRAGARLVPMSAGDMMIAKITGDAAVSWHGENASVSDSAMTFGAVRLSAKTIVGMVKFSIELAQDSLNIERAITTSLTSGIARAVDSAGLIGVTSNAAAAPSGVADMASRQTVTSVGTPADYDFLLTGVGKLLVANVPLESIGGTIMHPNLWTLLAKLKTGLSGDKTPLQKPPAISDMPFLPTTACPAAKAFGGNWSDLLYGVRQDIRIQILRERFLGDNLQIAALCFARVDFRATREESFVSYEGITGT